MFSEIAAGLPLILESAVELASAADALQADHARSKEILTLHAEEEAAKRPSRNMLNRMNRL
jgi:hypothetical protein